MKLRIPLTVLSLVAVGSVWAQETPAPTDMSAAPAPASGVETTASQPSVSRSNDKISVDFPDEEIRTVLRNVADLFELNLIVPDTLAGRTSIKLRDVTWREIFRAVLEPVQYTFVEEGNLIKIVSNDSLKVEQTTTEVFILNYAKAGDIKPSLDSLVEAQAGGRIQVDTRSNALIITERPSRMGRIRPIIEKLDKATDQVMIESKFVDVNDTDLKDLGVDWTSLSGYAIGAQPGNTAVRGGSTVPRNDNLELIEPFTQASTTFGAVFSANQFLTVLRALKEKQNSRLVSNPTIVTLNNQEAAINIGEEYPIPNYSYNQERGNFEVSGFTYKPIGILLKVTPQVNNAGIIKLSIEPEVSSRAGTASFGGASGAEIPIISTRKTKTQVSLKDGYTMGIGGLLETNNSKGEKRVPLLGDIPGLGRLFRGESQSQRNRNLLVFITAKTVNAERPELTEIFDPRAIRDAGIKREDLPGYRAPIDPFAPSAEPAKR